MKKGVIGVISGIAGAAAGAGAVSKVLVEKLRKKSEMSDKHLALYLMMNQWVQVKQDGKSLVSYFEENGYKNIAIYGMNYVGQTLYRELEGSSVCVKYSIDANADNIYADCDVISMEDNFEEVDAVVVTPIYYFDSISDELESKVDCPVISLEDILYEV